MTLDGLDIWQLTNNNFVAADSESRTHFSLNNDPNDQDSHKVRIITSETSHGNGPWHA